MSGRTMLASLALGLFMTTGVTVEAAAQVGANQGVLNPNLASRAELLALPGVTEAAADAIIEARPHLSMLALDGLLAQQLGDGDREELYSRLFLPINLNDTSEDELLLVPGVGDRMAYEFDEYHPYQHMAVFRREIGKYVDDEELARLEQFVFVPLDLNTASAEDILTIPGVGDRMLHEFEEYRPYQNMEQFRREMGKYVDDGEVARLERYVVIR